MQLLRSSGKEAEDRSRHRDDDILDPILQIVFHLTNPEEEEENADTLPIDRLVEEEEILKLSVLLHRSCVSA